jgi:hypothetical protein
MTYFREVAEALRERVAALLFPYSVTLLRIAEGDNFEHSGSGTLVKAHGEYFVLTAAHCISEKSLARCRKIAGFRQIGLVIEKGAHRFTMPIVHQPIVLAGPESAPYGPDLAFLPIPPPLVGTLQARKMFYNLDKPREELLSAKPDLDLGLWAFVGTPASASSLDGSPIILGQTVFFQMPTRQYEKGDFDYLEIGLSREDPVCPPSFAGVSGGGVFRIDITGDAKGPWDFGDAPILEGCAFYEKYRERFLFVRCHGRQSIYQHGLAAITGSENTRRIVRADPAIRATL